MTLTNQQPYTGVQLAAPYCKRSSIIKDDRKKAQIISRVVSEKFGIPEKDIKAKGRKAHIIEARQTMAYFMRMFTRLSLTAIALECGGFDHTTILWSLEKTENLLGYDKLFIVKFNEIKKRIESELIVAVTYPIWSHKYINK
jgi:chromosomal replication initiation ATPase DnaA